MESEFRAHLVRKLTANSRRYKGAFIVAMGSSPHKKVLGTHETFDCDERQFGADLILQDARGKGNCLS